MAGDKFQAPRGTHDVLPSDTRWWATVRAIEEQAALYGYGRIQTPGFEDTGLFARTSGEASDVVHKEMYSFTDRGDRPITLRPEGTAPIARAARPRLHGPGPPPRAAAGEALHDRADVPLRPSGPRALPRALAALARGD